VSQLIYNLYMLSESESENGTIKISNEIEAVDKGMTGVMIRSDRKFIIRTLKFLSRMRTQ